MSLQRRCRSFIFRGLDLRQSGQRRDQRLRVRVLRGGKNMLRGVALDDFTVFHHRNAVTNGRDGKQVVRDVEYRRARVAVERKRFEERAAVRRHLEMEIVVAGETDFMISDLITSLPQVRAGNIKAYAVAGPSRLAAAPQIPTVDEAGAPGLYASFWHGLWAPKGTPKGIIAQLDAAVVDALADSNVRARLADLGQEIFPRDQQTPEGLRTLQKAEIAKWWPVIKAAGIKPE